MKSKLEGLEAIQPGPADRLVVGLSDVREQLPEIVGETVRILVDNPKAFVLLASLDYVVAGAIVNLVKPRGLPGVIACGIATAAASAVISAELWKRGVINIKVRDEHGRLVPLYPGNGDEPGK